jgi:hypothetical protein
VVVVMIRLELSDLTQSLYTGLQQRPYKFDSVSCIIKSIASITCDPIPVDYSGGVEAS